MSKLPTPLILFDGHCHLCDGTVDRLLSLDRRRRLTFAPLQGSTADDLRQRGLLPDGVDSVILVEDGERVSTYSDAVLGALVGLGGLWRGATLFRLLPRFLRDPLYRWVARNRYRWFGRRDTCRLPSPQERERFLP
ncbi:MAG: DCC1-like thiol-disulfide oxidoreductase family protein [Acidobacteriota bacterium]